MPKKLLKLVKEKDKAFMLLLLLVTVIILAYFII